MKYFPLFFVGFAVALLVGACALSPEEQHAARVVLDDMLSRGQLTMEQHKALVDALARGEWSTIWHSLAEIGAAVVLSLLGVRQWRGSISARRGVTPIVPVMPIEPSGPVALMAGPVAVPVSPAAVLAEAQKAR